jgi:hypothetical protein
VKGIFGIGSRSFWGIKKEMSRKVGLFAIMVVEDERDKGLFKTYVAGGCAS